MNNKKILISVIVLAKNEADRIGACLSSLSCADEIIVIDNDSNDDTKRIAQKNKAAVFSEHSNDFSYLRNIGASHARGEWLLYVDADEIVTKELDEEIKRAMHSKHSEINGYIIRRKNYYLGHEWPGNEHILRLMKKGALQKWYGKIHETAKVTGSIDRLASPLYHYTHRDLSDMVDKTNQWSKTEAGLRLDIHHPKIVWWRLLRVMATAFFDSFVGKEGWRVGTIGWIESIYQAFSIFITYAKLWELQENKHIHNA